MVNEPEIEVEADQSVCISSGQCVLTAPEIFDQRDDDGIVVVRTRRASGELISRVQLAEALCPARAIVTKTTA